MNERDIELAEQAGVFVGDFAGAGLYLIHNKEEVEKFADLIRADERDRAMRENAYVQFEREECAKVCDAVAEEMEVYGEGPTGYISYVEDCAKAIRARSEGQK